MAADVSSLVRVLGGCKEDGEGKRDLVTRDLLGGGGAVVVGSAAEVELERPAVTGWDLRRDFMSVRTYGPGSGSRSPHRQLQDLNLPPMSVAAGEDSAKIDLKLVAPRSATASRAATEYRSVCTLEKVKSALERAERESRSKQRRAEGLSPSPSSSTTTSSGKRGVGEEELADGPESSTAAGSGGGGGGGGGGMMAAGCPRCLLYVLISKRDPRCPRCASHVPVPALKKRPRIDLNSSED